jgi:DNA-binding NarL/FixJ family response regulator
MPLRRGSGSPTQVQVWVVGRYALVNRAFEALLLRLPGVEIAGRATTLEELSPQSMGAGACLVLWILPAATDFESLSAIQTQHLSGKVLLFSMDWTSRHVQESLNAGVVGCLSAGMSTAEIGDALRQARKGEVYLPPELARELILGLAQDVKPATGLSYDSLTSKEKEILPLVCHGLSNKQIAQSLYLSVRTVENHLANIYEKLGVRSRTEAAVWTIQNGWL